ncbi:MAG: hypothetical protein C6I01_03180, partial [Epsilonproteobacteria bacterium]|nr:hypothetical protein [Campylobacterota bacterium]NPA88844.1 hypothetical protein [Campylobacterota bacterium]
MKRAISLSLFLFALGWSDSFLTYDEYAQMIYTHPHGVSCAHCHGVYGEGKQIGTLPKKVIQNNKVVIVKAPVYAPNIQRVPYKTLLKKLNHKKSSLMPRYPLLTPVETKAIWFYLNSTAPKAYRKYLARKAKEEEERKRRLSQQQKGGAQTPTSSSTQQTTSSQSLGTSPNQTSPSPAVVSPSGKRVSSPPSPPKTSSPTASNSKRIKKKSHSTHRRSYIIRQGDQEIQVIVVPIRQR